ncbi:30S ribosomal protein S20 [Thiolinea disciformis]|uniref:30S ribosomal protein S20 n=1 Tax=Thiolinea disciformis TaxID=125614 RepID=UPI00036A8ECF|nr:30S ribosomal protein S20 [Thiolinea disciformis]
MPNITSAKKRVRQSEKRRMHNKNLRSRLRTQIKGVLKAVEAKDRDAAVAAYQTAVSVIDSTADKGIIHKNKAARHKSRLNAHIRALAQTA